MDTGDIFDKLRIKSIKILEFIFQVTQGDTEEYITRNHIAEKMNFSELELNATLGYLHRKNFINCDSLLGLMETISPIYIAEDGIRELESLYEQKTEYEKLLKKYQTNALRSLEAELNKKNLIQTNNQGINAPHEWNGFYFRSQTEIKIAKALDHAGVLFYPNNKARLNSGEVRDNKESDFLIFKDGKFGILEVDGEPWHPPSRTVDDHERDRLFKAHGICIVEHYDATRCWDKPDEVVQEFLEILSQA